MDRGGQSRVAFALALVAALAGARVEAQPAATGLAIDKKIGVLPFDALGMDADKVDRLESLFRMELERLAGAATPSRRDLARTLAKNPELRKCTGESKCLAAIGKKLAVDLVVSGNVAELGDSYVVNIKVIDAASGEELRRIASDPLRGNPDELIEAVRVAAYRLLAPEALLGQVAVLADIAGAKVALDGKPLGKTPLAPIDKLALGPHTLEVDAAGYSHFREDVTVHFQKTSRVLVRLAPEDQGRTDLVGPLTPGKPRPAPVPWYGSTWFYVGVGVAAVVVGGVVGYRLAKDTVIDCGANPDACRR